MTIKATGAVTSSVANTAKRVIVMVYMAAVTGKVLTEEQKIGAGVAIGFVLVYSARWRGGRGQLSCRESNAPHLLPAGDRRRARVAQEEDRVRAKGASEVAGKCMGMPWPWRQGSFPWRLERGTCNAPWRSCFLRQPRCHMRGGDA